MSDNVIGRVNCPKCTLRLPVYKFIEHATKFCIRTSTTKLASSGIVCGTGDLPREIAQKGTEEVSSSREFISPKTEEEQAEQEHVKAPRDNKTRAKESRERHQERR